MNYKVNFINCLECNIERTSAPTDEKTEDRRIFSTYTEAKNKLISLLQFEKRFIETRIKQVKAIKKADIF